jgi:hypothetical protein
MDTQMETYTWIDTEIDVTYYVLQISSSENIIEDLNLNTDLGLNSSLTSLLISVLGSSFDK